MKLYIAAPWIHRLVARQMAQEFRAAGYEIVSRWHDEWGAEQGDEDSKDPIVLAREAAFDFTDVLIADVMVVLNLSKSEGKAVEQGIALTAGVPVVVIGTERFNVFQYLDSFRLVPDFHAAITALQHIAATNR